MHSVNKKPFTVLRGRSRRRWQDGLIWKWVLEKNVKGRGFASFCLGYGLLAVSCEHSEGPSAAINGGECSD
jgi:hypothetical protein